MGPLMSPISNGIICSPTLFYIMHSGQCRLQFFPYLGELKAANRMRSSQKAQNCSYNLPKTAANCRTISVACFVKNRCDNHPIKMRERKFMQESFSSVITQPVWSCLNCIELNVLCKTNSGHSI